jgi:hypothetical protein
VVFKQNPPCGESSQTMPLFIEVTVSDQESERLYICELDGQECCPEFFVLALYIQLKCYNVYHTVHCWSWTTQIAALKH